MTEIHYIHLDSIDSTNNWVKREAHHLDQNQLTCVTADAQTAGKGRLSRKWFSPKGVNIYVSFFFVLQTAEKNIPNIAQLLSISCAKVLLKNGFHPQLKWPNDLLIREKKVAGVLAESIQFHQKTCIVAGLGLNVNMSLEQLTEIDQPATSLFLETGKQFSLSPLLQAIALQFSDDLALFQQEGFKPFYSFYDEYLALKGKQIILKTDNTAISGICHSVSEDGRLNLLLQTGEIKTVSSGDLSRLKS